MKPLRTRIRLFIFLVVAYDTTSISYAHIVHAETFNFYPGIDIFEFKNKNYLYRITQRIYEVLGAGYSDIITTRRDRIQEIHA